jgi:hypothetical protein
MLVMLESVLHWALASWVIKNPNRIIQTFIEVISNVWRQSYTSKAKYLANFKALFR